jgi:hypothetical protein
MFRLAFFYTLGGEANRVRWFPYGAFQIAADSTLRHAG